MKYCKRCKHQVEGNYCSECGQLAKLKRIDRVYIAQQLQNILSVEKGFFYTTKELFVRPEKAIRTFLLDDRDKFVKPLVFLVFTSIIFSMVSYALHIEYSYFNVNNIQGLKDKVSIGDFGEWLNGNIGYTNLIIGCFMALWVKLFSRNYNIYEIIVMLCFVLGEATLLLSFTFVMGQLTQNGFVAAGLLLVFFLYLIWAIGQFFGRTKLLSYGKSFMVLILGYLSYFFVFILIGYIFKQFQS